MYFFNKKIIANKQLLVSLLLETFIVQNKTEIIRCNAKENYIFIYLLTTATVTASKKILQVKSIDNNTATIQQQSSSSLSKLNL